MKRDALAQSYRLRSISLAASKLIFRHDHNASQLVAGVRIELTAPSL